MFVKLSISLHVAVVCFILLLLLLLGFLGPQVRYVEVPRLRVPDISSSLIKHENPVFSDF